MADVRFADFDAAWKERDDRAQPLTLRVFGQEWSLPGTPPAAVVLLVARLQAEGKNEHELSFGEMLNVAAQMVPPATLKEWCDRGIDTEQLADIIMWQLGAYGLADGGGEAGGEAPAPEGAPSSSSNDGDSSKPTSPASIPTSTS